MRRAKLSVDLFPFLGLFLCVFGVMSLLQILISVTYRGQKTVEVMQGSRRHVPITFTCRVDSLQVERPATDEAIELEGQVPVFSAPIAVGLEKITDATKPVLEEMLARNHVARDRRVVYEEFAVIVVEPGGGECYHRVSEILSQEKFLALRRGLLAKEAA